MARRAKKEVAVVKESLLGDISSELDDMGDDLGYSQDMDDRLIPILSIIQDNSGEVKKKHSRYIEDAEPGMLIIRALQKTFSGSGVLEFQPCAFVHVWAEWSGEPGDGRPVGQYPFTEPPAEAKEIDDSYDLAMPNGNRLVDTRQHFGFLILDGVQVPVLMPMSGSNHGVSKMWHTLMDQFKDPTTGRRVGSYFRTYILSTNFQQDGAQSWYKYQIKDAGWVQDKDMREAGRHLKEGIASMKYRAGVDTDDASTSDSIPV